MGQIVRIVCLANSRRQGGRCIAGKLVRRNGIGPCIRPVSSVGDGALSRTDILCDGSVEPYHLSLIDIPFLRASPNQHQTENFLIDRRRRWLLAGEFPAERLPELCDHPPILWENGHSSSGGVNDQVPEQSVSAITGGSLFLVNPSRLTLTREMGFRRMQVRAEFVYQQDKYGLAVTDPRVETALRQVGAGSWKLDPNAHYLCISLGLPFDDGYAYKLVAGIIGFTGV